MKIILSLFIIIFKTLYLFMLLAAISRLKNYLEKWTIGVQVLHYTLVLDIIKLSVDFLLVFHHVSELKLFDVVLLV